MRQLEFRRFTRHCGIARVKEEAVRDQYQETYERKLCFQSNEDVIYLNTLPAMDHVERESTEIQITQNKNRKEKLLTKKQRFPDEKHKKEHTKT